MATGALLSASPGAAQSRHVGSPSELTGYQEAERIGQAHRRTFDPLDFDIYSNQRWDRFTESHSPNILVHYPDGHTTRGLPAHIDELRGQFTFAPDTRIRGHPVRIASGEWTSVIGVMEGTFSRPMLLQGAMSSSRPEGRSGLQ